MDHHRYTAWTTIAIMSMVWLGIQQLEYLECIQEAFLALLLPDSPTHTPITHCAPSMIIFPAPKAPAALVAKATKADIQVI